LVFVAGDSVVTSDHDCGLVLESFDAGAYCEQASRAHRGQAEMFVQIMVVETLDGGLQDVRCRHGPVRVAPPITISKKRSLRLSACQAEPSALLRSEPCGVVFLEVTQSLRYLGLSKPLDIGRVGMGLCGWQPVWWD
jgi:hypothetical protein